MMRVQIFSKKYSLMFVLACVFMLILLLATFLVFILNPEELWRTEVSKALQGPSFQHLFGTDSLGRDLFFRTMFGAQISLGLGVTSSLLALIFGVIYGSVSALRGGLTDVILMRSLEVFMSLPQMITVGLMVLLMGKLNAQTSGFMMVLKLVFAISLASWMLFARLSRNITLREKSLPYIEAARAIGASSRRIFFVHILKNMSPSLMILTGLQIPNFLLFEGLLSFLGIGVQPPVSSWGLLLQEGWRTLSVYPHLLMGPAAVLFATVFCLNIIFDELRQTLLSPFGAVDTHH